MSKDIEPDTIIRWIVAILVLAFLVLALVFLAYASQFSKALPAQDARAAWGQFGDFIGGTSNPILAFLTLTGLLLTLLLQVKQLQNSRQELLDSRQLVVQSNESQARAASELSRQALSSKQSSDLAGVNLLLEQYRAELSHLRLQVSFASDPRQARIKELSLREARLLSYVDAVYDRIVREFNI